MGGCRCSYRNCKVRSDGQTHMFHFPVFDKMRCHQWITNSHKPNFLNLKLSQLKNRVICQHHFTDDNFMNFKRDKLKTTAVPTEDGPYCVLDQKQTVISEDNDKPVIPINPDDIENETLNHVDKKAHSSVKYGDFLISDVTELFNSSHNNIDSQASQKASKRVKATRLFSEGYNLKSKSLSEEGHNYTIIYSNDEPIKAANETVSLNTTSCTGLNPSIYAIEYEEAENPIKLINTHTPVQIKESESLNISKNDSFQINPDKVVKIISEKTISEPVVVEGKLEHVSPSMIISRHTRKNRSAMFTQSEWDSNIKPQVNNEDTSVQASNNNAIQEIDVERIVPIEYVPKVISNFEENQNLMLDKDNAMKQSNINLSNIEFQNNSSDDVQKQKEAVPFEQALLNCMIETAEKLINPGYESKPTEKPVVTRTPVSNKSLLKNKITPEKLAAIEAKRKFNLKLRDVISCLDNLDDQSEAFDKKTPDKKPIVKSSVSSKATSPSNQGKVVDYLEARLQKMENTLLSKIDNNTQRINELKRIVKPSKSVRNVNTQTYMNHMTELAQKQYLYKEISKFLSPNAIIKVYDELFLQQDEEIASPTSRKLRKRR